MLFTWTRNIMLFLLFAHFVTEWRFSRGKLIIACILGVLLFISAAKTSNFVLIKLFLLLLALRKTNMQEIVRIDLLVKLVILIITASQALTGSLKMYSTKRLELGFSNPNDLGMIILGIFTDAIFLKAALSRIKIKDLIIMVAIIAWLSQLNISRTMVLCALIAVVLIVLGKINPKIILNKAMPSMAILAALGSYLLAVLYKLGNPLFKELNKIMSDRIYWSALYLDSFKIRLFGQDISDFRKGRPFDNAYLRLLIEHGVIVFVIVITLYFLLIKKCIEEKNAIALICAVVFIFYGISEGYLMDVSFNFTLLMFSKVIWKEPIANMALKQNKMRLTLL